MTSKTTKLPAESTVAVSNARRGWYRIFPVILGEKWDPAVAETCLAAGGYTGFAGNIDSGRRHRRAGLAEAL